ncbi:hypothetical protein AALA73_11120 [Parasutterella excrementihominis]|nr:hypothetical protein [Parasutterella excrementihominis]
MEKTTRQDSRMAIRKNCGQNYIFVVLHFNLFGLAKQAVWQNRQLLGLT